MKLFEWNVTRGFRRRRIQKFTEKKKGQTVVLVTKQHKHTDFRAILIAESSHVIEMIPFVPQLTRRCVCVSVWESQETGDTLNEFLIVIKNFKISFVSMRWWRWIIIVVVPLPSPTPEHWMNVEIEKNFWWWNFCSATDVTFLVIEWAHGPMWNGVNVAFVISRFR